MTAASLAIFVLLGQAPAADPTALVAQLGSRRYADREAAAVALERLGRQALPILRTARTVRDLEIRTRASGLVNRIEGALLTQPTLIALDFQDRPLLEVLKAVGDQAGLKLNLGPENDPGLGSRRITLRAPSPVPFWKAIDRLCEAGQLRYNPLTLQAPPGAREPSITLSSRNGQSIQPTAPTFDSGPFRATLVNLHFQRDVLFGQGNGMGGNRFGGRGRANVNVIPPAADPAIDEQFYAQIQLTAEPRLALSRSGPLKIIEAVDDRGQSLATRSHDGLVNERFSGYFGMTAASGLPLMVPLAHPSQAGHSIKRFKGVVPVTVSTRKPGPLVVPLSNAAGKTFQNDDAVITVRDIRTNPATRMTSIDLLVRSVGAPSGAAAVAVPPGEFAYQRPDLGQQQIEVLDAQGRALAWYNTSPDPEGSRLTLTLAPHNEQIVPAELRYHALAHASAEVAFEFENVPMP